MHDRTDGRPTAGRGHDSHADAVVRRPVHVGDLRVLPAGARAARSTVNLAQCIMNYMPICCTGSACTAPSTVSEATVTACEQMYDTLDCNGIVNVSDPTACLTGQ